MQRFSGNTGVKVKVVAKWPKSAIQPVLSFFSFFLFLNSQTISMMTDSD